MNLRRRDLLLSLKYSTIEACFSVPMLNLTLPNLPFVIAFAVHALDAGPALVGFMASLPHWCNAGLPPLTRWLQRRFSLYRIMTLGFVINALPWAILSLVPSGSEWLKPAFLAVLVVATMANGVTAVTWSASIAELVPPRISGTYFGRRNLIFGFWTLLAVLAAGVMVDAGGASSPVFNILFALAASARLIGLLFLTRMHFPRSVMERPAAPARTPKGSGALSAPNYRRLILYVGLWGLLLNLGMPFYPVYLIEELNLTFGSITVLTTIGSLGGLVALRSWGRLTDHHGNRPVLIIASLVWAVSAVACWSTVSSSSLWQLYLNFFIVGGATAGFQLCQFNLMIRMAPPDRRAAFIAVFLAVTSILTAFGPLLGSLVLEKLPLVLWTIGDHSVTRYHAVFAGSMLGCLALTRALTRLEEPEANRPDEVWRTMRSMKSFNPFLGAAYAVEFVFTPRGLIGLSRLSMRSLRRQFRILSEIFEIIAGGVRRVIGAERRDQGR